MGSVSNAIGGAIGTAAGSAAAAPITGLGLIGKAIDDVAAPLLNLIPDPKAKAEAAAHIADQKYQLALVQIDQQNKILEAASSNIKSDPHSSASRAYFCGGITTMILVNYGVLPIINLIFKTNLAPLEIPGNILWIFATIMLGFIGVPSVMGTLRDVMGSNLIGTAKSVLAMPGESQVSALGIKLSNKS